MYGIGCARDRGGVGLGELVVDIARGKSGHRTEDSTHRRLRLPAKHSRDRAIVR
eukprot:CAMPEP_0168301926 /NCGR_PEP_ID=MMETSP0142_2-20121227/37050_1 /TAXON_ID=44445 /ORGANISM="Pseudo-nitzschia australis, Strain 10249 10 AB" /LENGTH=53 /DNA_ID=CAMNT_0008252371 /DNA_START=82 /DNA_END=239 /DNA_ORIENTATION=+